MTITDIAKLANDSTDEIFGTDIILGFFNEAISNINIDLSAKLPYVTSDDIDNDYTALDEEWIRAVVVPYISYMIKTNDGSLNEADNAFYLRYQVNLRKMKKLRSRSISPEYRFWWETATEMDFTSAPYKLEYNVGENIPDGSVLPLAYNTKAGTVAAVYTSDYSEVLFYKIAGGSGVKPIGTVGPSNVGWFGSRTTGTTKSGIVGD